MTGTFGAKHKLLTPCSTRTIIFQRESENYLIVFITQCTLFFQNVCRFYCQYVCRALSVKNVCNETLRQVTTDQKTTCLRNKIVLLVGSHVV